MIVVLMGVTGAGKTTIGTALSDLLQNTFADADDYHPATNKEKMRAGQALNDSDRHPWLETLNSLLRQWHHAGTGGVLACSALKEHYRETLKACLPENTVHFVLLTAPKEILAARLAQRQHAYMNPALLQSQLDTLEPPAQAQTISNDRPPQEIAAMIAKHLGLRPRP